MQLKRALSQPQRRKANASTWPIANSRAPPATVPWLVQYLDVDLGARIVASSSVIVHIHLARAIILEENRIRIRSRLRAASRCVGAFAPVSADDGVVLAVPVVGKVVNRETFVSVDDVICSTGSVDCGFGCWVFSCCSLV